MYIYIYIYVSLLPALPLLIYTYIYTYMIYTYIFTFAPIYLPLYNYCFTTNYTYTPIYAYTYPYTYIYTHSYPYLQCEMCWPRQLQGVYSWLQRWIRELHHTRHVSFLRWLPIQTEYRAISQQSGCLSRPRCDHKTHIEVSNSNSSSM